MRERVRPRTHADAAKEAFVRRAVDAHACRGAVRGEEAITRAVDEHARDAREIRDRVQVAPAPAVEDVDAIGAGVRHEETAARGVEVRVGMVETGLRAWWHGGETDAPERHAALAFTFSWQ